MNPLTWSVVLLDDCTHTVPNNDTVAHFLSASCVCRPVLDEEGDGDGKPLWNHNAADGREGSTIH